MIRPRDVPRGGAWAAATAVALIAAALWIGALSVEYLALLAGATAASAALALSMRGSSRGWAVGCAGALVVLFVVAIPAQLELRAVRADWEGWRRGAAERALDAFTRAIDRAIAAAVRDAERALDAPADRESAFDALRSRPSTQYEHAVVLFDGDSAFAWGGMVRVPVADARPGVDAITTPTYLSIRVTRARGSRRATSVILVDAAPPGDRLARPLAATVVRRTPLGGFAFLPATDSAPASGARRVAAEGRALFDVIPAPTSQGEVELRVRERARLASGAALGIAQFAFIIAVWRSTRETGYRLLALAVALAVTAIVPLNEYSNLSRLFSAVVYFAPLGRRFTANAGALAITSAMVLLGVIAIVRRRRRRVSRLAAAATVVLVAVMGPFLLRDLARGINIPTQGVDTALWLIWQIPLFLAAVSVLLAGAAAGATIVGRRRGAPPWLAPAFAAVAAMLGPVVWQAPGQWPWWYTFVWIGAVATLALTRRSRSVALTAAVVAALGAMSLVWGRTARGRVELAERDLRGLSEQSDAAAELLQRFADQLATRPTPLTRQALLSEYVRSDLAAAEYPVRLTGWASQDAPQATLETARFPAPDVAASIAVARSTGRAAIATVPTRFALTTILVAPGSDGGFTTVAVAPKSALFSADPLMELFGVAGGPDAEPPYTVALRDSAPLSEAGAQGEWRRRENELHGDWVIRMGAGAWRTHVEVDLRPLPSLVQRGTLILLVNVGIVGVLWLIAVVADGGAGRWLRARRRTWWGSYRARLSFALFVFFVIPAAAFAVWSYQQLANYARQLRELQVRETLRAVVPTANDPVWVDRESRRVGSALLLYRAGELRAASDTLFTVVAPLGRYLDPRVELALQELDEGTASTTADLGPASVLMGYRTVGGTAVAPGRSILAAPARADDASLDRRRRDLGILVLFTTALGGLAALWLSGVAARQLARPIRTLREAALAIAGNRPLAPLEGEPTTEFRPVFSAFQRMASDLHTSRSALEEAQRRTSAVLRNVASGVVAISPHATIALANPRAELLLGEPLVAGSPFRSHAPAELASIVSEFLDASSDERDFEVELGGRRLRGTLTRLARSGGGVVVTLDDVTELARAQRVLAWGEMARQVAHEIKNPLTPIRLGVQHLKRARADGRVDFDRVLDQNVARILAEIDRLDEIARAFSKYGSAPEERPRPEPTDVAAVVRDVVALERMGAEDGVAWELDGVDAPHLAMARRDELKEVLLNVLENARLAQATRVRASLSIEDTGATRIVVTDDGQGIAPEVMPRIFEPHFSTRTSGSGLGLAISRQIIEGWGGSIGVSSTPGDGATVTITLRPPERAPS